MSGETTPATTGSIPLPDPGLADPDRSADAFTVARVLAWVAFGVVTALAVAVTAAPGGSGPAAESSSQPLLLLLFFVTIVVGSSMQTFGTTTQASGTAEASRTVDVGSTAALALAVTPGLRPGTGLLPVALLVVLAAVGLFLGGTMAVRSLGATGLRLVCGRAVPRVVTVAGLTLLLTDAGAVAPLDSTLPAVSAQARAMALLAVLYGALLLEAPLRALFSRRSRGGYRAALADAVSESITLGVVPASTAVLVAVAQPLLGLPALPLILLPLMFNQVAVRRHDEMREHARQSVVALSHLPEAMGMVRPGHAARVADLSTRIGRELGLGRRELAEIERAALLHDLGQVRLDRPVPSGATVLAAPADQEGIAGDGAEIARATGVLDVEAEIIEAQAVPYRHHVSHRRPQPVGSRVIRVANAYDDLLTGRSAGLPLSGPEAAIERLYLGLGHEYDPRVVDVLDGLVTGVSGPGGGSGRDART